MLLNSAQVVPRSQQKKSPRCCNGELRSRSGRDCNRSHILTWELSFHSSFEVFWIRSSMQVSVIPDGFGNYPHAGNRDNLNLSNPAMRGGRPESCKGRIRNVGPLVNGQALP
jgi:hypothetical protein